MTEFLALDMDRKYIRKISFPVFKVGLTLALERLENGVAGPGRKAGLEHPLEGFRAQGAGKEGRS
jgi:hypothetical protein